MTSGSRALFLLAVLAAIGAVVFLLVGNPFAPTAGPGADGEGSTSVAPDAAGVERGAPEEATASTAPSLASGFDVVGTGEVAVRLLRYKDRKPIAGQVVRLHSQRGESVERPTGEDGRVLVAGLRAGRDWTLAVAVEGLAPVEVKGIAVRRGVTDLGDLLLGERAVLHGRVIDTRGQPVAGALVAAYLGGTTDWSQGMALALLQNALAFPEPADKATTDARGEFTLASLVPGAQYDLSAKKSGLAFNVQSGLVVSPERTGTVLTIVLGQGAAVRGKVIDETGKGVAEATVVAVEDAGASAFRASAGSALKKDFARTKPDGSFALDTLMRGGSYRFGVVATGIAPSFDTTPMRIDIETTRDFHVVRGGVIEGVVTDKQSGEPVADARVLAISGSVGGMGPMGGGRGRRGGSGGGAGGESTGAEPSPEQASTQTASTDATGRFRLEGLRPGPVAIGQVKAPGYADFAAMTWTNNGWGEVRAGETLTVAVTLEPGGTVTGKVLGQSADGLEPLPGAQVALLSLQSMFTGYPTATAGADGSYEIHGVRAGSQFLVTATANGFVAPSANPMDPASQMKMPDAGGVVTKDVTLTAAGAIEGRVADSKGTPVAGARVRVRSAPQRGGGGAFRMNMVRQFLPGGGGGTVLTDGAGLFLVENVASDEPVVVMAETDEFVPSESEPVQVRAGETQRVDVVLQGGATLRGRVVDDRGAVVANARLRVGTLSAEDEAEAALSGWRADRILEQRVFSSDGEGLFEITKIKPGRVLLRADRDGYVTSYRRDLRLSADQVQESHVVTLTKGETISGVIKGDDGKPVGGASVAVTRQENPARGFGGAPQPAPAAGDDGTVEPTMADRSDEQGRFTVENVPPGTSYSVLVWFAPGYRGYAQGEDSAIRRGVAPGSKDVEIVLKKMPEGENPFPFPAPSAPRAPDGGMALPAPPPGTGAPRGVPPPPAPSGPAMGS